MVQSDTPRDPFRVIDLQTTSPAPFRVGEIYIDQIKEISLTRDEAESLNLPFPG